MAALTAGMAMVLALVGAGAGGSRVAVLPVESHSTLPDSARVELRHTIERGLRRSEVEIASEEQVDVRLDDEGCRSARCVVMLAESLGAAWILRPTITETDSVYEVQLEALDASGHTIALASERCEICGYQEVRDLIGDRSAAMGAKVERQQRLPPRLLLRSSPSRAVVWIDGRRAGRTPLEQEVTVGAHEVRVSLPGHVSERRMITAVAGVDDALSFTMIAEPARPPRDRLRRGVGAASLTVGATLVGAGIGLVALDEHEYEQRCNPDPLGNCSQRYDTMAGGIALIASGGVLAITGVVALVVDHRTRKRGSPGEGRWRAGRGLAISF